MAAKLSFCGYLACSEGNTGFAPIRRPSMQLEFSFKRSGLVEIVKFYLGLFNEFRHEHSFRELLP